jgi:basic amino acid/polyamine antiporter, APA family
VAELLRSPSLFILVWIVGALYAMLGANAYAELATMIPESGGHTVFVRRGLGRYPGFVVAWTDWLSTCGAIALAALVIGESTRGFFRLSALAVSTVVVVALALIQIIGVKTAGRTQEITAAVKTLAFAALVIACFVTTAALPAAVPQIGATVPPFTALVLSMQAVIFTYDGYYGVVYFSGEIKNPERNIPRAIFGGVLAVAAIYLLVNIGFLRVLSIGGMAGDPLVAATVAGRIFGARGDAAIRALTIVSLISAVNAFQLMASRVLYRLGARGFVAGAAVVNEGGTPVTSLLISTGMTLAMMWTGTFEEVLALTAFLFVAQYALDFLSLIVLRKREPATARPFRAWGHPWTTWGVLAVSIVFLGGAAAGDTRNTLYSMGLLALSWPIYLLLRGRSKDI